MSIWSEAERLTSYYGALLRTALTGCLWAGLMIAYPFRPRKRTRTRRQVYVFDAEFLRETQRALTPGPDEEILVLSGIRKGNLSVPLDSHGGEYDEASPTRAKLSGLSNLRALSAPQRVGRMPVALVHSHPGSGPHSVEPSALDRDTQARYESAGYEIISGIFSRGSPFYVRFFSESLDFGAHVCGNGVRQLSEGLYEVA